MLEIQLTKWLYRLTMLAADDHCCCETLETMNITQLPERKALTQTGASVHKAGMNVGNGGFGFRGNQQRTLFKGDRGYISRK